MARRRKKTSRTDLVMRAGAALLGWIALEWAWHLVSSHAVAFGLDE
jgi:hypothetical protein